MPRSRNSKLSRARRAALYKLKRSKRSRNFCREVMQRRRELILRREEFIAPRQEAALDDQVQLIAEICYMVVEGDQKLAALITLLKTKAPRKSVVLMPSIEAVEYFSLILKHFLPSTTVMSIHEETKAPHVQVFCRFRDLKTSGLLVCTDAMALLIFNLNEIDCMIQFDPPWCSINFVFRWRKLLLFLQPSELSYVQFIRKRHEVSMIHLKLPDDLPDNLAEIRQMQMNDRRLMTKANHAFSKYVLSYAKHECEDLVRGVAVLDYGRLAVGYGLLRLPDFFQRITSRHFKIHFFKPVNIPWPL